MLEGFVVVGRRCGVGIPLMVLHLQEWLIFRDWLRDVGPVFVSI